MLTNGFFRLNADNFAISTERPPPNPMIISLFADFTFFWTQAVSFTSFDFAKCHTADIFAFFKDLSICFPIIFFTFFPEIIETFFGLDNDFRKSPT